MNITVDYQPTKQQEKFHKAWQRIKLYGGAVGGGKSVSLCMEGMKLSLTYFRNRGFLARKTFNDFRKTTMKTFFDFIPEGLIKQYNKADNLVTFLNDSEIQFGDCENSEKLKSLNLGWYGIDEASEVDRSIHLILNSRLRLAYKNSPNDAWKKEIRDGHTFYVPKYFALYASNPEPCWLFEDIVDPATAKKGTIFVPSLPTDNPYLPTDYVDTLKEGADEDWISRYLLGSWKVFEGQVYKDFIRDRNVIKPFPIPKDWNRYRSIDLGVDDPTVCLWLAVDPQRNVYVYREYYEHNRPTEDHAESLCIKSGSEQYQGTIFDHHALGKQLIMDYNRLGVKGGEHQDHKVIVGIARVQQLLKPQGLENKPKLFVFDTCVNTIREFEAYRWDKHKHDIDLNSKEQPIKKDDHTMDCLKNWTVTYYYTKTPTKEQLDRRREDMEERKFLRVTSLTGHHNR